MTTLLCTIDSLPVPAERIRLKGIAAATCSKECYAQARKRKRESRRSYRFSGDDRALLLRMKRAKFTLSDFPAFMAWWRSFRRAEQSENKTPIEAANSARHDLNVHV